MSKNTESIVPFPCYSSQSQFEKEFSTEPCDSGHTSFLHHFVAHTQTADIVLGFFRLHVFSNYPRDTKNRGFLKPNTGVQQISCF